MDREIVLGGALTALPACYIVDEQRALRAARRFWEDGQLDPELEWEPY